MKKKKKKKKAPQKRPTAPGRAPVAIIMGSDSDYPVLKEAAEALKLLEVKCTIEIVSAHRTPEKMRRFAHQAAKRGVRVIIAGAGGAAHLPGMVASLTPLPVIGVPVAIGPLGGQDALYSIVQMPRGVPVATVAIGNAWNAGLLAAQILATHDPALLVRIARYKDQLRLKVENMKLPAD